MNTKLTLTMEQSVIEKAKKYAKSRNRSLSDLIENYLKALTNNDAVEYDSLSSSVQALRGAFEEPKGFDYQKELTNQLCEKYLDK